MFIETVEVSDKLHCRDFGRWPNILLIKLSYNKTEMNTRKMKTCNTGNILICDMFTFPPGDLCPTVLKLLH
jgi:hypothetical protein